MKKKFEQDEKRISKRSSPTTYSCAQLFTKRGCVMNASLNGRTHNAFVLFSTHRRAFSACIVKFRLIGRRGCAAEFRELPATCCFRGIGFPRAGNLHPPVPSKSDPRPLSVSFSSFTSSLSAGLQFLGKQFCSFLFHSSRLHLFTSLSSSRTQGCCIPVIIPFSLGTFIVLFTPLLFLQKNPILLISSQKWVTLFASRAKRATFLCSCLINSIILPTYNESRTNELSQRNFQL